MLVLLPANFVKKPLRSSAMPTFFASLPNKITSPNSENLFRNKPKAHSPWPPIKIEKKDDSVSLCCYSFLLFLRETPSFVFGNLLYKNYILPLHNIRK